MCILRFLTNWSMQSYAATITCSIVVSLTPNGILITKGHKFYNKIHIKWYFVKLFTDCDISPQVMIICFHLIKHVPLGFNTLVAPTVCILRAKLWKIFMKLKIVMVHFLFLKNYIFEVVTFYIILQWFNQPNFCGSDLNL